MRSKPKSCSGCPAYNYGVGFVPPSGPPDAKFTFIGQGPGRQEADREVPFFEHAPSGKMLTKWIQRAGHTRQSMRIGNTVQCYLPEHKFGGPTGNRDPKRSEQLACWERHVQPWLMGWASRRPDGHIIAVGGSAYRFLMNLPVDSPFEKYVGPPVEVDLERIGT